MNIRIAVSFAGAVILLGCAAQPNPNVAFAQQKEEEVADTLKDPTSAKFKDVVSSVKAGCIYGKILAKNSVGAYTGYHDFVWIGGSTSIEPEQSEVLDKTEYLQGMNAYMENIGKCQEALPHGTGPDRESNIPDT